MEKRVAEHPDAKPPRLFPGEQPAGPVPSVESVTVTVNSRRLGFHPDRVPLNQKVGAENRKVGMESQPTELDPAADATFVVRLSHESKQPSVVLHYRPLNQTLDWKRLTLQKTTAGSFQGAVSSKDILSRHDFQFFVEVLTSDSGRRFPSHLEGQPYFVVPVRRN